MGAPVLRSPEANCQYGVTFATVRLQEGEPRLHFPINSVKATSQGRVVGSKTFSGKPEYEREP